MKLSEFIIKFGCDKPGGRPLSPSSAKAIGPAGVCLVKRKKDGKTVAYKKKGAHEGKHGEFKPDREKSEWHDRYSEMVKDAPAVVKKIRTRVKKIEQAREEIFRRVDEIHATSINFDPGRFQYKIFGSLTATGEVGSLEGVRKYDPNLAGILQVWKDPADGKIYVVNGHNRLALAKRAGVGKVAVRFLEVGTPKEARAIGALTNIAEGRGTALDAAKFFRDTGITREELEAQGVRLKDKMAADGLAISRLPGAIFAQVAYGDFDSDLAAAIGRAFPDPHGEMTTQKREAQQYRLYEMVTGLEKKGRRINGEVVNEMASLINSSETGIKVTQDLFGETEEVEDAYFERANLQAGIKRRLNKERRVFATAGKNKEMLEKGGSQIETERALQIAKNAGEYGRVFDEFKNDFALSQILNEGAQRLKNASTRQQKSEVEDAIYAKIYQKIPQMVAALGIKTEPKAAAGGQDLWSKTTN